MVKGVAVDEVIVNGTYFTIGFADEVPAIVPVVFVITVPAGVKQLTSVIVVSYISTLLLYVFFSFAFVGAFGPTVSTVATDGIHSVYYEILFSLTTLFMSFLWMDNLALPNAAFMLSLDRSSFNPVSAYETFSYTIFLSLR